MSPASKSFRLIHRAEFLRFFNEPEVFRLSFCVVFRIKNDLGHYRLGITLKAKGSSVERNLAKRLIRSSFDRMKTNLGSYDYNVVIPAHKGLKYPFSKGLRRDLYENFPKQVATRST